ncbi:MAG: hypothetical protein LRY71_15740 [Bacillaceae bacterium]|nr:hypothetical protein [Bacillaceae bacterium]
MKDRNRPAYLEEEGNELTHQQVLDSYYEGTIEANEKYSIEVRKDTK